MTRPEIIRADTIDLQSLQNLQAPSRHGKGASNGTLAPHQAETLREVAAESAEESLHSPRAPWVDGEAADLQQQHAGPGPNRGLSGGRNRQMDDLAIAQNGGQQDVDDVEVDSEVDGDADDDMMDKISSSPSIEDEDIDFEFVYALHTFVATVEGQANATKGDTMVLLDDSNSYWWLVRVVKDSSIGYLPAEHIETPTERLARLNKHRNIDLSASMLGDQAEKTRNPIKTAMKRRKTKTVQFAAPTYVDYSDFDYSTDEEDIDEYFAQQREEGKQQQQQQATSQQVIAESEMEDESAKVQPLETKSALQDSKAEPKKQDAATDAEASSSRGVGVSRGSEDLIETRSGDGPKKTSDGTVRDSFFKDDTVETKKITLTPVLFRDDGAPRGSSESKDLAQRPSLDKLDKDSLLAKDDKKKKDRKEKDKKPSAIRSFFSRKDKKMKGEEDDDILSSDKRSLDSSEVQEREVELDDAQSSPEKGPQRQSSKLQKVQPRAEPSPTRQANGMPKEAAGNGLDLASFLPAEGNTVNNVANVPPVRRAESDLQKPTDNGIRQVKEAQQRQQVSGPSSSEAAVAASKVASPRAPGRDPDPRPQQQRAIQPSPRTESEDADSGNDLGARPSGVQSSKQAPGQQQKRSVSGQATAKTPPITTAAVSQLAADRLSDSPVEVSPISPAANPPPLMMDTSSQEDQSSSRLTPSPDLDHEDGDGLRGHKDSITTSTSTATTNTTSTWNDTSLRAFFDSGSDIRDLLVVVYDKNDDGDSPQEHHIANSLFKEQNAKLAEITTQLDNMLGDWLARKQRLRTNV